jgi:hypothetical protein
LSLLLSCRTLSGVLFIFWPSASGKALGLYEKFFSPRGQGKLEVSLALTQAGVTEQIAVSHVKSRVGAGAKKIFRFSAWLENKKGAQNKNKEKR